MIAKIFTVFLTAFLFSSFARAEEPGFDRAKWDSLVNRAIKEGDKQSGGLGTEYRVLSRFLPADLANTHSSEYYSAVGYLDVHGIFVPTNISVVSEHWVLNAQQDWEIDQWIFKVDLVGELTSISHNFIKKSKEGGVLEYRPIPVNSANDATSLEIWDKKRNQWLNLSK